MIITTLLWLLVWKVTHKETSIAEDMLIVFFIGAVMEIMLYAAILGAGVK